MLSGDAITDRRKFTFGGVTFDTRDVDAVHGPLTLDVHALEVAGSRFYRGAHVRCFGLGLARSEHREDTDGDTRGRHRVAHPAGQLAGRLLLFVGGRCGRRLGQLFAPSSSSAFLAPGCSGTGSV